MRCRRLRVLLGVSLDLVVGVVVVDLQVLLLELLPFKGVIRWSVGCISLGRRVVLILFWKVHRGEFSLNVNGKACWRFHFRRGL